MNDQHLYNSRIVSSFLEFLNSTRPEVDIQDLLSRSGILPYEVEDEGHWLTQKQVDDFHDALIEMTDDPSLFREAGRYMLHSRSVQSLRQFIVGFITPLQAYKMLGKITSYISRGSTFKATGINRNKVEIVTAPVEGVKLKPYQCENSMGAFEAVSGLFSGKPPSVEHPDCIHRGGECCRYILSWEEPDHSRWRRRRNYMAAISIAATAMSAIFLSAAQVAATAIVLAGIVSASAFYAMYLEKRDLHEKVETQGDAASRLLDQITIGYNNSLMIQEIGQAVSSILDVDKLLRFIMETLEKRLKFDRAMIMMANHDRTRLTYMMGYGYTPEMENYLSETQFRLDNPRARGPFVVAFKRQSPFLVENIKDLEGEVSPRSLEFIRLFRVNSFICVPIVYEGKSEGILAVDNYSTGRPNSQSEVSLLMGIAQQIAISINNARSLQQVMEREERFRALSENSPDIIYTTEASGEITYINPAAEDILKYSMEEMAGKNLAEFADPGDVHSFERLFHSVSRERDTIKNVEVTLLDKNGRERLFYMSGAPNLDARGEMMGIVGTLKDVSAQRQLERQLQHAARMKAIGRLTGGISHDFNNVLQAITSYNKLLMINKTPLNPDWDYLVSIRELTRRATELVSRLLLFSRKVDSRLSVVDINEEIRSFSKLLKGTLPKTIDLKLDILDEPYLINCDSAQLGQVIMNLAVNARDAMPEGGALKISTEKITLDAPISQDKVEIKKGKYVLLKLSDTGHGISPEYMDHIFKPFFTTKKIDNGTGIGLSVVYGIIKSHNGYIFCRSEPNKGTDFEIYLPYIDAIAHEAPAEEEENELRGGKETILLVDDELTLLETGHELLSMLGYDVLTAQSGESALEIIRLERERISLVVLDLMMPGMSGDKCLPEILKIVPSMKVIIASGYTGNFSNKDIMSAGAADILQKPYQIEHLSSRIREILDKSL